MSVDGTDVSFDEFMYYLKTAATTLTKYYQSSTGGGVDWDGVCIYDKTKTNAEWCVNEALYNAAQACVIMSKGKSMNCLPTDEQLKTLEDNISAIRKNYENQDDPDAAFTATLNGQGFTLDSFKAVNKVNFTLSNIFASLYGENGEKVSDEILKGYIDKNGFMTSAHILFKTTEEVKGEDGKTTEKAISDSAKAEKKAKAEKLAKELKAIKDDEKRKEKFLEYMKKTVRTPARSRTPTATASPMAQWCRSTPMRPRRSRTTRCRMLSNRSSAIISSCACPPRQAMSISTTSTATRSARWRQATTLTRR